MLILAWVLSGLVTGLFIGRSFGGARETSTDLVLGVVGGVLGGVAFRYLGPAPEHGVELWSFLLPVVGAATMLGIYYAIVGRKPAS